MPVRTGERRRPDDDRQVGVGDRRVARDQVDPTEDVLVRRQATGLGRDGDGLGLPRRQLEGRRLGGQLERAVGLDRPGHAFGPRRSGEGAGPGALVEALALRERRDVQRRGVARGRRRRSSPGRSRRGRDRWRAPPRRRCARCPCRTQSAGVTPSVLQHVRAGGQLERRLRFRRGERVAERLGEQRVAPRRRAAPDIEVPEMNWYSVDVVRAVGGEDVVCPGPSRAGDRLLASKVFGPARAEDAHDVAVRSSERAKSVPAIVAVGSRRRRRARTSARRRRRR